MVNFVTRKRVKKDRKRKRGKQKKRKEERRGKQQPGDNESERLERKKFKLFSGPRLHMEGIVVPGG